MIFKPIPYTSVWLLYAVLTIFFLLAAIGLYKVATLPPQLTNVPLGTGGRVVSDAMAGRASWAYGGMVVSIILLIMVIIAWALAVSEWRQLNADNFQRDVALERAFHPTPPNAAYPQPHLDLVTPHFSAPVPHYDVTPLPTVPAMAPAVAPAPIHAEVGRTLQLSPGQCVTLTPAPCPVAQHVDRYTTDVLHTTPVASPQIYVSEAAPMTQIHEEAMLPARTVTFTQPLPTTATVPVSTTVPLSTRSARTATNVLYGQTPR